MTRLVRFVLAVAPLAALSVCPLVGQMATSPIARPGTTPTRPGARKPCWEQAGISRSAMAERRQIGQSTRAEVESVCGNSSLTPQQRQAQIRQIREQARARMNGLVSPQQMQALRSCRAQRGLVGSPVAQSGLGPCGAMPSGGRPNLGTTTTPGAQKSQTQEEEPEE